MNKSNNIDNLKPYAQQNGNSIWCAKDDKVQQALASVWVDSQRTQLDSLPDKAFYLRCLLAIRCNNQQQYYPVYTLCIQGSYWTGLSAAR